MVSSSFRDWLKENYTELDVTPSLKEMAESLDLEIEKQTASEN